MARFEPTHFLLTYSREEGRLLRLGQYMDKDLAWANRLEQEERHRDNPAVEVVLLHAESLDAVKRTHARYFYTPAELAHQLADAVSDAVGADRSDEV